METLKDKDVENLIEIGKLRPTEINQEINLIEYFKDREFINILDSTKWEHKIATYSDNDLIFLFKGLVLIERELQWIGGSVASAIWVYRVIMERNLDADKHIASFAVEYSYNTYVPFGSSRVLFGWESSHIHPERIAARNSINRNRNLAREKREYKRSEKRSASLTKLRELSFEERGNIRNELLRRYASLSIVEKLEMIAYDEEYPPEYYPFEWISISDDEIQKLPTELIKELHDKLSSRTKGQWKRFANELKKYDDGT